MSKKIKFINQFGEFRKHKKYVVAENVASHFLSNGTAILIDEKPCKEGDCEDCEDCKGKNKKKASKVVIESVIESVDEKPIEKPKKKTPKKKKAPTKK